MLEIFNYILFGTVILIQVLMAVFPFLMKGKLYYPQNRQFFKRFPTRGRIFFTLALSLVGLTIIQFIVSNEINDQKEDKKNRKDSINHFSTVEMLAKYHLEVDTNQKKIVKLLQDSLKNSTTIISSLTPYFKIDKIEMAKSADTTIFKVTYCSKEAVSYEVNVLLDIYGYDYVKDSFVTIIKSVPDISMSNITPDQCLVSGQNGFIGPSNFDRYIFFFMEITKIQPASF